MYARALFSAVFFLPFSLTPRPISFPFSLLTSHISPHISPPRLKDLYEGDWAQWTQELNAKGLTLNGDMM